MSKKPMVETAEAFVFTPVPNNVMPPKQVARTVHDRAQGEQVKEGKSFTQKGRFLWAFKAAGMWRLAHEFHKDEEVEAYESFNAYLGDPRNKYTASTAHLAVQVFHLFVHSLSIDPRHFNTVGQKKLARVTPFLQSITLPYLYFIDEEDGKLVERVLKTVSRESWLELRSLALEWLQKADTLSDSMLAQAIEKYLEHEDAATGIKYKWETRVNQSFQMSTLLKFQQEGRFFTHLGVDDLTPTDVVEITIRHRVVIPNEEPGEAGE